jgi:predicted MFS family arabinose efflux permease
MASCRGEADSAVLPNNRHRTREASSLPEFLARQWGLTVAVAVGLGLAHSGTSTMPLQIGALMDGAARSASQAGLFGFCEVGALAIGMIAISPWIDRIHPFMLALAGAMISSAASAGLYFVRLFPLQLFCGTFAGLGFGCVFAATIAGAAASNEADRLYGLGNAGALLLITAIVATLPVVTFRFGQLGIFIGLAAIALAAPWFFAGLTRGERIRPAPGIVWRRKGACGLLLSWAAMSLGTGALYAFSERIGRSIHLSAATIGAVLAAGIFIGVLGTATAAILGRRVNRKRALTVGIVGTALSCLLLGYSSDLSLFAAGVILYWMFYMFLYSCLLGTAAQLDHTGRIGALGGGMERLGYSVGAWVGGVLAEYTSYSTIGLLGFSSCILGLVLGCPSLFRALEDKGPS